MMTKQEFLSGSIFRINGSVREFYKFIHNKEDGTPGYIVQILGKDPHNPIREEYHASVKKVTKNLIVCYNSILGKTVRAVRDLANYEVVL